MAVTLVVHKFKLGDVDDPILYAAQPIWEWQQTEAGKWVMEHAIEEPMWGRSNSPDTFEYLFRITAQFNDADATFFKLKYDRTNR
jgi:hypothetical protein